MVVCWRNSEQRRDSAIELRRKPRSVQASNVPALGLDVEHLAEPDMSASADL